MDENQLNALLAQNPGLSMSKCSIVKKDQPNEPSINKKTRGEAQNKYHNYPVYVFRDGFVYDSSQTRPSRKEISGQKAILVEKHGGVKEVYDSKKEYVRCLDLRQLEKLGRISGLKRQCVLVLQPAVQYRGERLQAVTYCADFMYQENGETIVEDVKGYDRKTGKWLTTQVFDMKWKLLKARYPDYFFKLY